MTDSLTDFIISQQLLKNEIDPFAWELSTYIINRQVYDRVKQQLDELGYSEER